MPLNNFLYGPVIFPPNQVNPLLRFWDVFVISSLSRFLGYHTQKSLLSYQWTLSSHYALNLRNVVITELWHYSFYIQRIFTTRQNTLFLYPGRPTHILVIYRRVSALGQAACSPWWSYLNRKKCLQFFLERLVFSRQHTGIAISPKRYLFVENCLSQASWSYMIPPYFRFKTVYTLLNLYSFAIF